MVGRSIERWAHRKQLLYIYTERHYHHSQNDDGDTYLLGAFAEHFTALEIIRNFVSGLTVFYTKIPFINYVNACVRCSDIRLFVSFTIIFTLVLSFVQFHFVYIWKFMSEMLKCVCERTQPFCFPKAISRIDRCISIFEACAFFFSGSFSLHRMVIWINILLAVYLLNTSSGMSQASRQPKIGRWEQRNERNVEYLSTFFLNFIFQIIVYNLIALDTNFCIVFYSF